MHSEQINEISLALSKAQGEMQSAIFDKEAHVNGPKAKYVFRYASLNSIWDCCRSPLSKNELSVSQITVINDGMLFLETILMHSSGQWIKSKMFVADYRSPPQQIASSLTYMKRYSLSTVIGICSDDDDDANSSNDVVPDHTIHSLEKKNDAPKCVEKIKNYDILCESHNIFEGSPKMKFIDESLKSSKLSKVEFINYALSSIDKFEKAFDKWKINQCDITTE